MHFGVQEGQDSIGFPLHLELDGGGEGVEGVQEGRKLGSVMGPDGKNVIHIPCPHGRAEGQCGQEFYLEVFHVEVGQDRGER